MSPKPTDGISPKRNYYSALTYVLIILVAISLSSLTQYFPTIRYAKYIIPLPVFLLWLLERKDTIFLKDYTNPFLLLIVLGVIHIPFSEQLGIKDIFFISCPVLYFVFYQKIAINMRTVVKILLPVMATDVLFKVSLERNYSFSILYSTSVYEGIWGFIFGILGIYFLIKKDKLYLAICIILLFVGYKRIAILGFIVTTFIWYISKRVQIKNVLSPLFTVPLNITLIYILIKFSTGEFNYYFHQLGLNIDHITMGRKFLYASVVQNIIQDPYQFLSIGFGIGSSYIQGHLPGLIENLHSDILKISYEYGLVAFILFISLLYSSKNFHIILCSIYLNILFISDNVLIYVGYMFFHLLVCSQLQQELDNHA